MNIRSNRWRRVHSYMLMSALALAGCKSATPSKEPAKEERSAIEDVSAIEAVEAKKHDERSSKVEIVQAWSGRISLSLGAAGGETTAPEPMIIRDDAAYTRLIELIPKKSIQMKQPAPDSDDPLLQRPKIDFAKHMLVAVFRADTMYVHPKLSNPRKKDGALVLDLEHPPLGDTAHAAARADIGTYAAVLVSRDHGDVKFDEK